MYSSYKHAAINRLLDKEVEKSVLLHDLSDNDDVIYVGPGTCNVSDEQLFRGKRTLKIVRPRKLPSSDGTTPHMYDCGRLRITIDHEDWTAYNRLSFWVYPVLDVYKNSWFSIELKNEGEVKYPRSGRGEGLHYVNTTAGRWNHVVWEIPDVPRDQVTQVQLNFEVMGKKPEETDENIAYVSTLELQKVEADKYMGWDTNGEIIVSHSGYLPAQEKIACISSTDSEEFQVIHAETETVSFTGKVEKKVIDIGTFFQMDFSPLRSEGSYYLKCGEKKSYVFPISNDVWLPSIQKIGKFFYTERCGVEVEGVHSACHLDSYVIHPDGRRLPAYGGWHDAADLSQFLCNTAEASQSFLDMASAMKEKHYAIYEKSMEEARHGLSYLLRTQFDDGYRVLVVMCGVMTDGEKDSCSGVFGSRPAEPFETMCAAAAEATAYGLYQETDMEFAKQCLKTAEKDFDYAMNHIDTVRNSDYYCAPVQLAGEVVFAAIRLYGTTKRQAYLDIAVKYADVIVNCQQTEPTDWEIPFVGFFYEDEEHSNTLSYNHQAHEQIIIQALAELIECIPEHMNAAKWKGALELYRKYILKLYEFSEPYGLLPSFIYLKTKPAIEKNNFSNKIFNQENYERQVEQGIRLNENVYLRRIPVMTRFRGGFGVWITKAKAVSALARALGDEKLWSIAIRQLQWVVGNNPFNRSYMYGEGYDYPNMEAKFFFDVEGEIPVGIQCYEDTDIPYMPMTTCATYFEVYVHPVARFLWTLRDLYEE